MNDYFHGLLIYFIFIFTMNESSVFVYFDGMRYRIKNLISSEIISEYIHFWMLLLSQTFLFSFFFNDLYKNATFMQFYSAK